MAQVIFLGTAASIPTKTRDTTSFIFRHKKLSFLVDCPGSIVHKLLKTNIDFRKLSYIIITHDHPDHYYGLFHLIHATAYLNKKLEIFTNKKVASLLSSLIRTMRLDRPPFPKVTFRDVFRKAFFYQVPSLKIKALKNKHIPLSFGIKFFFNKELVYSSDTALSKEIIKESQSCDYVIHDCTASSTYFKKFPQLAAMHTDSHSLCCAFKNAKIKKLIPIHFLLLNAKEEQRIRRELKPLGKKTFIPFDFMSLHL